MATPSIRIEQVGAPAGVAGESRTDLVDGIEIFFYDDANVGAGTHIWEVFFADGGTAALTGENTQSMSFTAPVSGTYLAFKTFDGETSWSEGSPGQRLSQQGGVGISEMDGSRVRHDLETSQFSVEFLPVVGTFSPEDAISGELTPENSVVGSFSSEEEIV